MQNYTGLLLATYSINIYCVSVIHSKGKQREIEEGRIDASL